MATAASRAEPAGQDAVAQGVRAGVPTGSLLSSAGILGSNVAAADLRGRSCADRELAWLATARCGSLRGNCVLTSA